MSQVADPTPAAQPIRPDPRVVRSGLAAASADQGVRHVHGGEATSTSTCRRGRSSPCSARPGAARPRRCGWSPASRHPTSGTITLAGQDITYAKPYRRPVNTVFQNYALFPHLDIFENVAFGLRRRKKDDVDKQVDDMLELVELGSQARKQAGPALRWPAAAGRAGPGADQPARGAAARRAARRPRPQAAPADADRAQADPDRGRPHLRPRHPRPGGGHDDGRHHRGDERGRHRADGCARGALREPAHHVRRQLPRPVQPDRGHGHRSRRRHGHRRHARHRGLGRGRTGPRRR